MGKRVKQAKLKVGDCVATKAGASLAWSFSEGRIIKIDGIMATVDTYPRWHAKTKPKSHTQVVNIALLKRRACPR